MKLSQSYGRKENPQVDWKTVVIENRQMVRMGQQGAVVSEFELLWESAMLFGSMYPFLKPDHVEFFLIKKPIL